MLFREQEVYLWRTTKAKAYLIRIGKEDSSLLFIDQRRKRSRMAAWNCHVYPYGASTEHVFIIVSNVDRTREKALREL